MPWLAMPTYELRSLRRELGTHWLIRTLHYFQQKDEFAAVDLLNDSDGESLGELTAMIPNEALVERVAPASGSCCWGCRGC